MSSVNKKQVSFNAMTSIKEFRKDLPVSILKKSNNNKKFLKYQSKRRFLITPQYFRLIPAFSPYQIKLYQQRLFYYNYNYNLQKMRKNSFEKKYQYSTNPIIQDIFDKDLVDEKPYNEKNLVHENFADESLLAEEQDDDSLVAQKIMAHAITITSPLSPSNIVNNQTSKSKPLYKYSSLSHNVNVFGSNVPRSMKLMGKRIEKSRYQDLFEYKLESEITN